eukprot:scaffold129976_cov36-Phaeocystis_antarctica.AAC.2
MRVVLIQDGVEDEVGRHAKCARAAAKNRPVEVLVFLRRRVAVDFTDATVGSDDCEAVDVVDAESEVACNVTGAASLRVTSDADCRAFAVWHRDAEVLIGALGAFAVLVAILVEQRCELLKDDARADVELFGDRVTVAVGACGLEVYFLLLERIEVVHAEDECIVIARGATVLMSATAPHDLEWVA